jgi:3,2-trans-enoyl-CoA isomerase
VNALNLELLQAVRDAVASAPASGARGIVLSGGPGVFSGGLDVPTLLTLESEGVRETWQAFMGLCETLARSVLPVVAALTGHAPAGGAVLSLFCDYRVMARGPYRIGLNETQVGLVIPEPIQYAFKRAVGARQAERLMVLGAMVESEHALQIGLVDELTDLDHVVTRSVAWLEDLLRLPHNAMIGTRALSRADLIAAVADPQRMDIARFIEGWYEDDTQAALRAMVARIKKGS